jgi:hypothetical protein
MGWNAIRRIGEGEGCGANRGGKGRRATVGKVAKKKKEVMME